MAIPIEHYRKKYLIPESLQRRVCMCDEPSSVDHNQRLINCCVTCSKPFRWNVRICTICKTYYIKDFRRLNLDCVRHARCWEHTFDTSLICHCEPENTRRQDFGPLGLNPKKFTREELEGTFSFASPF